MSETKESKLHLAMTALPLRASVSLSALKTYSSRNCSSANVNHEGRKWSQLSFELHGVNCFRNHRKRTDSYGPHAGLQNCANVDS